MIRMTVGILVTSALLTSGCSSKITHSEIESDLVAGSVVKGIPYRTPKRYKAVIYAKSAEGYQPLAEKYMTLPDPDRLYVIGFESKAFSNAAIDLKLNGDNTIQSVALTSTSTGAAALTALGSQVTNVTTAQRARDTAQAAAATAAATAETTSTTRAIAAVKAKEAAELAQLQYDNLLKDPAATNEQVMIAAHKAYDAKLEANEAARLAQRPLPYPEVIP